MKLLLDEMMPSAVAWALRERGHDVDAVTERSNLSGMKDRELLALAAGEVRVIVTENVRDFRRLGHERLDQCVGHAGIIYSSRERFPRSDRRTVGRLVVSLESMIARYPSAANLELRLEDPPEGA